MSNVIINCDLSQAELRCMAVFSGDEWMISALQEGNGDFFDTHMMPVCYPWILEDWATIEDYKMAHPVEHKEYRTNVKSIQYGLAFGRGAYAIGKALGISTKQAEILLHNYLSTAHKFNDWRSQVMEAAVTPAKRDLLVNPFGRRFQSEIVTDRNMQNVQREALSFLPQSTSSDICLATAIRINDSLKAEGYHIFNIVHDAIMIEGDEIGAEQIGRYVANELRATGSAVMGNAVPFLSDFSIGKSWADLD